MGAKQHQLHGRDHAPGGCDPIPALGLPTIKGVWDDIAPSADFFVGQMDQGDAASWGYIYQLPSPLLFLDPVTQYIRTHVTPEGGSPLFLVVISARWEGISGQAGINADPPGVHAAADQSDSRIAVDGTISLFTTGISPDARPVGIHAGVGNTIWFTEQARNSVARASF